MCSCGFRESESHLHRQRHPWRLSTHRHHRPQLQRCPTVQHLPGHLEKLRQQMGIRPVALMPKRTRHDFVARFWCLDHIVQLLEEMKEREKKRLALKEARVARQREKEEADKVSVPLDEVSLIYSSKPPRRPGGGKRRQKRRRSSKNWPKSSLSCSLPRCVLSSLFCSPSHLTGSGGDQAEADRREQAKAAYVSRHATRLLTLSPLQSLPQGTASSSSFIATALCHGGG